MTPTDISALALLVEASDLIVLHIGERKVGLGKDVQETIVAALKTKAINDG